MEECRTARAQKATAHSAFTQATRSGGVGGASRSECVRGTRCLVQSKDRRARRWAAWVEANHDEARRPGGRDGRQMLEPAQASRPNASQRRIKLAAEATLIGNQAFTL